MPNDNQQVATFKGFKQEFEAALPSIAPMLPKHVSPEKFQAAVITAVTINPDLLTVERRSLFNACRTAAELGLSLNPSLGEADILKQYDKRAGGYIARFSPRYGGLMKLGRQSGHIRTIYAHTVKANDQFEYDLGMDKTLRHKPAAGDRGPLTGVYCVWIMTDGSKDFEYMDRSQVEAIKARSSAKTKEGTVVGPWATDEEEMWRKTVVRRASKYWPRSSEMNKFLQATAADDIALDAMSGEGIPMDAVDVTDSAPAHIEHEPAPANAGAAAVSGLESMMGVAPSPEPAAGKGRAPRARMIAVPGMDDGDPNWERYATMIQEALAASSDYKKVLATNGIALNSMKQARPDLHEALMGFAQTLEG